MSFDNFVNSSLTWDLVKVAVSIRGILTITICAIVNWITSAQANSNTNKTGKYDKQTANQHKHEPRKLHSKYKIFCRV